MSEEKKNIPPENDSAQKKPTLEEDIKIYEEAVSIDRSRQKSRRVFVFYIIGLFCVALVLILLSYVMQAHANQELEALGTQLTEQTDAANGARAKVDQLQDSIDKLQADLAEAQKQNGTLTKQSEDAAKNAEALDQLWQLEKAYQDGGKDTAREIIDKMDAAYTRDALTNETAAPLTGSAAKEYADICDALNADES